MSTAPSALPGRLLREPNRSHIADVALALFVCWTAARVYLSHYGVGNALSSDNVMPYVLFDDLFHRQIGIGGFLWPESPFYFPDTVLAWILYTTCGALLPAVTAYAWINSTLFVLLVRSVLLRANIAAPAGARAAWLIFVALWLAVCLLGVRTGTSWFGQFYAYVFVPNNHSGTLLGVLAGLALILAVNEESQTARLLMLALLCLAMLPSDRLFEIQFMLPAIAYCTLRCRGCAARWHCHAALLLAILLAGAEAMRWLIPSDTMKWVAGMAGTAPGFQIGGDPTLRIAAGAALARMWADFIELAHADIPTTLIQIVAGAATAWILFGAVSKRDSAAGGGASRRRALFVALIVTTMLLPLIAGIVLGRHIAMHTFRYCQTIVLLLLPLALCIAQRFWHETRTLWLAWSALAVAGLLIPFAVDASRSALYAEEHDQENCLRALAGSEHLKFGVAEFWHALEMTARFPSLPVTAPLSPDAGPRMSMVTNLGWFGAVADNPGQIPVLDFVDAYSYSPQLLDDVFGKASLQVTCPRSAYRVYRPADGALSHLYRHFEWLPGQILQRLGRATLPAAAWVADERLIDGDAVHASGPLAPATPLLITAQDFPEGRIQAWLAYSFVTHEAGATAHWDITALDGDGNALGVVGQGVLAPTDAIVQADLPLGARPQTSPGLGISVTASGDVDVRIVAIGLRVAK
jgi:hypothetical protein